MKLKWFDVSVFSVSVETTNRCSDLCSDVWEGSRLRSRNRWKFPCRCHIWGWSFTSSQRDSVSSYSRPAGFLDQGQPSQHQNRSSISQVQTAKQTEIMRQTGQFHAAGFNLSWGFLWEVFKTWVNPETRVNPIIRVNSIIWINPITWVNPETRINPKTWFNPETRVHPRNWFNPIN